MWAGHVGALLRADPLSPLGGEVPAKAPPERRKDETKGQDHDDDRQHRVAKRIESSSPRQDDQRRAADECHAEAAAVDVSQAVALGRRLRLAGLGGSGKRLGGRRSCDCRLARPAP